jgi:hypothetical protein
VIEDTASVEVRKVDVWKVEAAKEGAIKTFVLMVDARNEDSR